MMNSSLLQQNFIHSLKSVERDIISLNEKSSRLQLYFKISKKIGIIKLWKTFSMVLYKVKSFIF